MDTHRTSFRNAFGPFDARPSLLSVGGEPDFAIFATFFHVIEAREEGAVIGFLVAFDFQ